MEESVKQYFKSASDSRRRILDTLHEIIMESFPEATVDLQYRMPTYHYKNGSVAIANQKNYVSLYTCEFDHIKEFKKKHPEISTGKGCIRFVEKNIIPEEEIRKIIDEAILNPQH